MRNLHISASLASEEMETILLPRLEQLREQYREQCHAIRKDPSWQTQQEGEEVAVFLNSFNADISSSETTLRRAVDTWIRLFLPLLRTEDEYAQQLARVCHHEYLIFRFNCHVERFNAHEAREQCRWAPMYRKGLSIAYLLCKYLDEHGMDALPQHCVPLLAPVAAFVGCTRGYRELLSKLKQVLADLVERAKRVQVHIQDLSPDILEEAAKAVAEGRSIASDIVSCQATEQDVIGFPLARVQVPTVNLQNAPSLCGEDG
ncbi:unnamed protein product [Phytomonas sp. EM1]|nr:unnamed protein product [Phytomonas sp. EM1]|eukprot:CCW64146.1 unnamed protein product [Phytomonas sp. isolate EM1]